MDTARPPGPAGGSGVGSEPTSPSFGSGLGREGPGGLGPALDGPGFPGHWLPVDHSDGGRGGLWGARSLLLLPPLDTVPLFVAEFNVTQHRPPEGCSV